MKNTSTRLSKIVMALVVALFFTVTVINNISDYSHTFRFIAHTLSMDTTAHNPHFMWRHIQSPQLMHVAFISIIAFQSVITILAWIGIIKMLNALRDSESNFQQAMQSASIAACLGFALYAILFIIIAGQWFMMRESATWNVQGSVHAFLTMLGFCFFYLKEDRS